MFKIKKLFSSKINTTKQDIWSFKVLDIDNQERILGDYKKNHKAFMIVNVASRWGVTKDHYSRMVKMHKKLFPDLQILAFPCAQFKNQEFMKNEDIKFFVHKNFDVEFPMFARIDVNGDNAHPLYKYMKTQTKDLFDGTNLLDIPWNFGKFLVSSHGDVVGFYDRKTLPDEMENVIRPLL